mgnify:CR=1 FL=1
MKNLIALFAVSAMASTAAVASIALSGTASVSYDDNGSSASATATYTEGGYQYSTANDGEGARLWHEHAPGQFEP